MNVSESVTPAELEPEPDSPVPIRMARRTASDSCQTSVTKESSPGCSKIARNGNAQGPVGWLAATGCSYPGSAHPRRGPALPAP